jgi:capsular polysaccharide biosynthesis protein
MAKNTVQGALIGLLLVIGLYTVQFLLDDTLKSGEVVEKTFGVMPLCVIPEGDIEAKGEEEEKRGHGLRKKKKGSTDAK